MALLYSYGQASQGVASPIRDTPQDDLSIRQSNDRCDPFQVLDTLCRTESMKTICGQKINILPTSFPHIVFFFTTYYPYQHLVHIFPVKLPTSCLNLHLISLVSPHTNQYFIFISTWCPHNLFTIFPKSTIQQKSQKR